MTSIPSKMRAVVLTGHGGMDKLEFHADWPVPAPAEGEVLIRVHACGLNNTDVNTRTAWYSQSGGADGADAAWGGGALAFPRIQGADVAGTVVAAGAGADAKWIGRRVLIDPWLRDWNAPDDLGKYGYFGSECDGGFADYATVDQRQVHAVDCDLSDAELATFATPCVTAENMLRLAGVGAGDTVLVPGASGGVGSALIQLAHRRGARSVAMCAAGKTDAVAALRPAAVLPRAPADLKAELRDAIGAEEVSVVADVVGGALWPDLIGALSRGGRYVCAGAIAGHMTEFDLRPFYLRSLTFHGAAAAPPGVFADVAGCIERGEIQPLLAKTFPLKDLHAAQQAFMDKKHTGNIVVTMEAD